MSLFGESLTDAWRARYGTEAPDGLPESLRPFLTHRCVRSYSDRPVDEATAAGLVVAAQSAGTSSNLQLYTILSVQDPERREALTALCDNQNQLRTAAWFFGFFADIYRLRKAAEARGEDASNLDFTEFYTMAVVDAALAAERMVVAAEALGLGVCYIGALRNDPEGVAKLLDLPEGLFGVFGLCIGWPADDVRAEIKPRLSQDAIWMRETYDHSVAVDEYDSRMTPFYTQQGMKGDVTWSMRSGRRLSLKAMTGREKLLEWLQGRGFLRR